MTSASKIILASRSPRRRELLQEAGYVFEVRPASEAAESGPTGDESPVRLVTRHAYQKAAEVAPHVAEGIVLGCDTVVECGGTILSKPADKDDARRMLRSLRGQRHRVLSGLCLWKRPHGAPWTRVAVTILEMDCLSDSQIEDYLTTDAWQGKAGAFGYQDRAGWIRVVEGSESNVVGLPLELLAKMLAGLDSDRPDGQPT